MIILRQGLSDKDLGVRIAVVEALGFVGGRLAMTVLSEALKDRSAEVRLRSVEALKDAGTINSIPIIQRARVKWCVNDSGGDLLLLRDG